MLKRPKLIIFDLDGTLADAYKAIEKSFNYTMSRLGYPKRGPLRIKRAVGWGDANLFKPFLKEKDLGAALKIYRIHHKNSLLKYTHLLPGAKKVLQYFKAQGMKLAIASNRPTAFTKIIIKHLKVNKYFDVVLCADKLKNIKPHPQILRKIMKKFSLSPQDTIYVGDMGIDVQAGNNAGVKTIAVTTGSSKKNEIREQKPFMIISNISKLIKVIPNS